MIKLKKVLESSARERLKKRVKTSINRSTDIDSRYINIVSDFYNKSRENARYLELEYEFFYETNILKSRPRREYLERMEYLFQNLDEADDTYVHHPDILDRDARDAIDDNFERLINRVEVPPGSDPISGVAFLLQFLVDNGFEIRKFGKYRG
jgi:hypothetical protein